ncbi:MAG: ABC transporter ATP-binding protein [Thermococcus sp.]|uniref:ABC transporter ATP-binding protein n=1 Tax=Thermococcus sp. TaxID=35749 RepID=UPI00260A5F16|nr:ABC transporter ATP-binding protein [Thermococcus sp.]MCD6140461.1 ABC transporter ATP-binding protein [Thermococcus sp.]MCD6144137.1 ABC transporter ATP-binding protein [Thermococcus sp.]
MIMESHKLTKRFGNVIALNSVSLRIPEGLTLILGPNGSGKSTLLKLALGLYKPTEGEIKVLGRNPWRDRYIKRFIGVSFDPPTFPKFISGKEWLTFIAKAKRVKTSEVDKVSRMFSLKDFIERNINTYSSGMMRKLSIAQAFLGSPQIIFLDEPFAGIDFEGMSLILSVLEKWKEKTNFVVISHIWEPIIGLADYVVIFNAGKVYFQGDPTDAVKNLRTLFHRAHNQRNFSLIQKTESPTTKN